MFQIQSVKVFRFQLPRSNRFYSYEPPKHNGADRPSEVKAALCSWYGTWKGCSVCGNCKSARYCSEKHQAALWRIGHNIECRKLSVDPQHTNSSSGPRAFLVEEVHKISVLDIRLANVDRHAGNILISKDSYNNQLALIPIDHGYCLPENGQSGFCSLDKIRNLSFPSDRRFQLNSFANLTLLSDCEPEPPHTLSRYKVGCDPGKNDADWVLAMKTKDPELIYATAVCKTVAGVPIRDYNEDDTDYLKMIRNGFDLEWVATNCSDCTTSGGCYGYKGKPDYKFQCFCDDRPHSRSCKPSA